MKNSVVAFLLTLIASTFLGCGSQQIFDITGEWKINPEKSVIEMSKVNEMTPDQMKSRKKNLTSRIPRFTTIVTAETISFSGMEVAYTTLSSKPTEVVIEAEVSGNVIQITFQKYDDESFKMLSSGTDDMDYLIWNRSSLQR